METNVLSYLRKTKITGVLIGAMALTAAVGCADLENVDPALIDGVVQNVDAVSGEVTLELPDGTTTTINLNDVDLGALNADSGSAVLSEGDEVGLTLGQDDSVTSITPTIVKSEGTIQMINADLLIVQITTENGIDISVNVDEQSRITARGKGPSSSSFDELTVGIEVDVEYNPETMDASRIHFHRNDLDRDDDELIGTISGVNVDSHTVTILGADNQELTLTITPATKIDQNGPATFAAIEAGAVADIEFDIEDESHVDASDSTDSPDVDEPDHADDHDVDEVDEPDHADDHDVDEIDEPDHADDHDVDDVDEPDHADDHDVDDVDEPDHADDHDVDEVDEPDHADDHDVDDVDEPDHADDHDVDEVDEPDTADEPDVDEVDEPDTADEPDVDEVDEPDTDDDSDDDEVNEPDTDDEEDEDDDSTSNSGSNSGSN